MFRGFTDETADYFLHIRLDNSKSNFAARRQAYLDCVKTPLLDLHGALVPAMLEIDGDLCMKPTRCVSGAFNDARFARGEPVKTYMYLHFCSGTARETDVPGFFMDASDDGYRYGLRLYHRTARGMQALRDGVLADSDRFAGIADAVERHGVFSLGGARYQKDHCPLVPEPLNRWLNAKDWLLARESALDASFFSGDLTRVLSDGFHSLADLYCFMRDTLLNL